MSTFGTTAWANKTNGQTSLINRLTMLKQELQRQIATQLRRLVQQEIIQVEPFHLDDIPVPDSRLAVETLTYAEGISPNSLFFHSLRTYYWGSILAQQSHIGLDPELFYVMSLLHDIGLYDSHNQKDGVSQCFAVEGGRGAKRFVAAHGFPEKAQLVEDAIVQHINLHVPLSDGPERHILPQATALDVVGARIREIRPDTLASVLDRYPRNNFKADLIEMFDREYQNRPNSRIAFMQRVANLNRLIQKAPFNS